MCVFFATCIPLLGGPPPPPGRRLRVRIATFQPKSKDGFILQGEVGAGCHLFVQARGGVSPVPEPSRHRPRAPGCGGPFVVCHDTIGYYLLRGTGAICLCPLWGSCVPCGVDTASGGTRCALFPSRPHADLRRSATRWTVVSKRSPSRSNDCSNSSLPSWAWCPSSRSRCLSPSASVAEYDSSKLACCGGRALRCSPTAVMIRDGLTLINSGW